MTTTPEPSNGREWTQLVAEVLREAGAGGEKRVAELVGRLLGEIPSHDALAMFEALQAVGLHLTPVHFYSPIPDTRELPDETWTVASPLTGIDLNLSFQLSLIRDVFPAYAGECETIPTRPTKKSHEFFLDNTFFDGTDAFICHCIVRHFKPAKIVEVGSGYSTRLMAAAASRNGGASLTSIEPYPDDVLRAGFPGLTALIQARVQDVDPAIFETLEANDILFIDSSHASSCGSDVNYLFDRVIPRVAPGVLVHLHDIFLPYEYPRTWILEELRFWNEQYLLRAFLAYNKAFEVVMANSYLGHHHHDDLKATFPTASWWGGGSFWIRRRSQA